MEVDPDGAGSDPVEQTFFLYEQGQIALQFDKTGAGSVGAGDLSHRYLWGPAVDMLLADEQIGSGGASDTLWALTDHLGSVRDLVDDDGVVQMHRQFDAFGNIVGQTGDAATAFAFTGKLFEIHTGLQQSWHRWYDPRTGRWASEDPIGFAAGDANLSRYVANESTTAIDPDGLEYRGYWAGVGDVFVGYGKAAVGTAKGMWFVVRHPQQTAYGVGTAIRHPLQTGRAICEEAYEKSGTLEGQGELVGDVMIGVATGGAAKAAAKSATLAKVATKLRLRPGGGGTSVVDDVVEAAPRGAGNHTNFANEAAEIMNSAARNRGLNPNAGVRAMAAPIREVDLCKLVPPPTRQFADPGKLERLGTFDMAEYRPIQVEDLGGGRYMIMDGMTRAEAARRAGLTKLPIQIFPKSGP